MPPLQCASKPGLGTVSRHNSFTPKHPIEEGWLRTGCQRKASWRLGDNEVHLALGNGTDALELAMFAVHPFPVRRSPDGPMQRP